MTGGFKPVIWPHSNGPVIRGQVEFIVDPVEEQPDDVPEKERLYRLRAVENRFSYSLMTLRDVKPGGGDEGDVDVRAVGRFVRSVLVA